MAPEGSSELKSEFLPPSGTPGRGDFRPVSLSSPALQLVQGETPVSPWTPSVSTGSGVVLPVELFVGDV